jgi:hypothetical protein
MPLVDMIEPPLTTVRIGHVAMGHPQPSGMIAPLYFFPTLFVPPFKSRSRLEAENAALRHQLTVLQRKVRGRVQFTNSDRLFFIQLYRLFPSVLKAITIIRPETLVRWHRGGFRRYWRWKSRSLGGRPEIASELRALIRKMSAALAQLLLVGPVGDSTDAPRPRRRAHLVRRGVIRCVSGG